MSNEPIEYCCEVFPKIMNRFGWLAFIDEEYGVKFYLMPYIEGIWSESKTEFRVNHCPSCGAVVRSIQLTVDQFIKDQS